jgi:hypothetical protein
MGWNSCRLPMAASGKHDVAKKRAVTGRRLTRAAAADSRYALGAERQLLGRRRS